MAKRINIASDADYLKAWESFRDNFRKVTPVDLTETVADRAKRVKKLESDPEAWFKYYFPNYCTSEPAAFHRASTKRIIDNAEWFEVRAWSRELAKSARSMMEVVYLALTGKIKLLILASANLDSAQKLLLPFKACFEANGRIINDYGEQQKFGSWESSHFLIKKGCAFHAFGAGQSPRGLRNESIRPDFILIDDIDTDEEVRNEDIQKNKYKWIMEALYATRSVSKPLRVLVNGNIIGENSTILKLKENADHFQIVNIRDDKGKSTWASKNTEEYIDRVLSKISYESAQKEYFNNPMDGGDVFKEIKSGKVPNLQQCAVVIYADPATSNRDTSSGSMKAAGIIAKLGFDYYIVKVFLDNMGSARFVDCLFELYKYCQNLGLQNVRVFIENNSLQNPFYEQVLLPLIYAQANQTKVFLPVTGDDRDKKDKYTRVEGTLEPLNRLGHLIFNEQESDDPNMKRLIAQFTNFSRRQKRMDGPDMVEGGVFKLSEMEAVDAADAFEVIKTRKTKKWNNNS
jgi:hypothetical protein